MEIVTMTFYLGPIMQAQENNSPRAETRAEDDPYLWLEDITGDKALDWVRARNAISQAKLEADAEFGPLRDDLLAILDSDERIPFVNKHGEYYYNFWRDKKNERGLWRRTTFDQFQRPNPEWEVLLDLDALAATEIENWIWRGAQLLRPDYRRGLVSLSRGGADATVTREFDLEKREFVTGGFYRPEAKGGMRWIDIDRAFVFTDFGEGSMTQSGYPRLVKLWRRGTPLAAAELVYEGLPNDMSIAGFHDDSPGFERDFVSRSIAFYNNEIFLRKADGSLVKLDAPNSANKTVFREHFVVELREPWEVGGRKFPAGALLVTRFEDFLAGQRKFEMIFEPTETTALASFGLTRDYLYINVLDDVKNRVYVLTPTEHGWSREPLKGAPDFGTVTIDAVDPDESNEFFMITTDYLTPTTLSFGTIGDVPRELKRLPAFFDATGLVISQHFATSTDGTRVPYFMVARRDLPLDGSHPTLLYGYGGFEIALQPNYAAGVGRAWTSQGGVYIVANIRGGGEYGPRWHQAALKANRPRAYEDFAAVARDLISRQVASPRRLGIQGGSNGGLLVGNMVTLYPDLFQAAVCQVPLLDMKRYNRLLAGASWMAEFGDPDKPEEWEFIRKFSPYQNVRADVKYPALLFTTSTRDDRVHPGHARKMMARMEEQGHQVLYYENIEGGHGGAANNRQAAYMQALAYIFLKRQLFP
jgi:prolyl oligopeptidase